MSELTDVLIERVRESIASHEMLVEGAPLLVMVSGGSDSVALLRLVATADLAAFGPLAVLHVDHGLRGDDSRGDAEFVERTCAALGVTCTVERVDIAGIAREEGLNLEDAGRRERYRLANEHLDQLCTRAGVSPQVGRIAVAHTRDDRTETFLMRVAQGSGATGLTSLRPVRGRVARPLIDTSRAQLRAYLGELGQEWREDETNADTDRLRSKIRHELVPLMREINPQFDGALERTLALLADEDDLLKEMGEAFARDFAEAVDGEVVFDRQMMSTLSRPIKRRTIRAALLGSFPETSRLEFEHVERLVEGLGIDGFAHDLPDGLRAHDEYGRMVVSRVGEGPAALASRLLPVSGICDLGSAGTLEITQAEPESMDSDTFAALIDADAIRVGLSVGSAAEGERMRPLGMQGSKKVSDLFVDAKIPRRLRGTVPVVRDGDRIVWVAGVRMSEEYKITETTVRAVRLVWQELGGPSGERTSR